MKKDFSILTLTKGGFGLLFVFATSFLYSGCDQKKDRINSETTFFNFSSKDDCDEVDVSKTKQDIKITRLEDQIIGFKTQADVEGFFKSYPSIAGNFLMVDKYPKGVVSKNLFLLSQDTAIKAMYSQVKEKYGDIKDLEQQFSEAFAHVLYYYPDFKIPKIYTIISGLGIETFVSDSIIVLSLDYFIGPKAKYKPRDPNGQIFPDYILRRYQKPYIVPACMLYISNKYNKVDMLDNTLLAEMVYYGKAYKFVKTMMPCIDDTLIIGYTGEQMKNTRSHETVIWGHLIERKAIYETSHFIKTKYTGERPYTAEIGPKCPGKIGTWLGWRIVDKYMLSHPDSSFQNIMKATNSKKLFIESKYKPEDVK
ncbi:MAG: gliding motility protein [Opitutaceae bacterium]|nr:gliding motility protein [Cytophagales bacterium]